MNRWMARVVCGCLFLGYPVLVLADSMVLHLDTWLEEALPRHPALLEAEATVGANRLRMADEWVWEDPEVRMGVTERPGERDEMSVALRLRLPEWGDRSRQSIENRSRLETAIAEQAAALRLARQDLGQLYLEAVALDALLKLAEARVVAMQVECERAEALLAKQRFERLELLEIRTELADATVEHSRLKVRKALSIQRLQEFLPLPFKEAPLILNPVELEFVSDPPSLSALRQRIMDSDAELTARLAVVQLAQAAVAAERFSRIPSPTFVQGEWTRDRFRNQDEWQAQVGISLPFFSSKGRELRERARLAIANMRAELRRDEIIRSSGAVANRYQSARQHLNNLGPELETVLKELKDVLAHTSVVTAPDQRMELIDDYYRLERDLLQARLDLNLAAWALHTCLWNLD